MRSSIAVSSIEHLKNGQKRPHSLISVSSSASSSGSSGMYGGGGLSITLEEAEGEGDSKAIPRSETVCSNGEERGCDHNIAKLHIHTRSDCHEFCEIEINIV